VALTRVDHATSERRWRKWWDEHRERHRVEWLIDALGGKDAGLRVAAFDDLRRITGESLGSVDDWPSAIAPRPASAGSGGGTTTAAAGSCATTTSGSARPRPCRRAASSRDHRRAPVRTRTSRRMGRLASWGEARSRLRRDRGGLGDQLPGRRAAAPDRDLARAPRVAAIIGAHRFGRAPVGAWGVSRPGGRLDPGFAGIEGGWATSPLEDERQRPTATLPARRE
jgi:hypothetical protein